MFFDFLSLFFSIFKLFCLLMFERETEGETSVTEKQRSAASHLRPKQGSNPQPRRVPGPGLKLVAC